MMPSLTEPSFVDEETLAGIEINGTAVVGNHHRHRHRHHHAAMTENDGNDDNNDHRDDDDHDDDHEDDHDEESLSVERRCRRRRRGRDDHGNVRRRHLRAQQQQQQQQRPTTTTTTEENGGQDGIAVVGNSNNSNSNNNSTPSMIFANRSSPGTNERRQDHLRRLFFKRKIRSNVLKRLGKSSSRSNHHNKHHHRRNLSAEFHPDIENIPEHETSLWQQLQAEVELDLETELVSARIAELGAIYREMYQYLTSGYFEFPLEVRMKDVTYSVPVDTKASKIMTVFNSSFLYPVYKFLRQLIRCRFEKKEAHERRTKHVLDKINLVFQPGKMYLVLGPPGSGKSTLLRAISGLLRPEKDEVLSGEISYNGRTLQTREEFHIENAFAYISELDTHSPRLTVEETFEFAFQCKAGGKAVQEREWLTTPEARRAAKRADREGLRVKSGLVALGLTEVKDTFVGDSVVRGISGGQRRRVTVGEMLMSRAPVLCGDEISTGLDAVSTYEIVQVLLHYGRFQKLTRIFALLQPSPQTVSLFDEVILLAEGHILYAGPIEEVEDYFAGIGYKSPDFVDVADFLQMVSSGDGAALYDPPESVRAVRPRPPDFAQLAEIFRRSEFGQEIRDNLDAPLQYIWKFGDAGSTGRSQVSHGLAESRIMKRKYANAFYRSTYLILKRFLVLWIRDKRVIIAGLVKNILMGVSVGGVFFNNVDHVSLLGVLFQGGLFIMLGAMQSASGLVSDRVIFYKHTDANFYSAWPFVFGRTLSLIPQTAIDTTMFGTILFFLVGLADRDGLNYLVYLSILITFALLMNLQLAIFASFASASLLQVCSACLLLLLILFGGFIVAPNTIPAYYSWLYWWNPFAWAYRALVVNEFRSDRWTNPDQILTNLGFTKPNGEPFEREWVGYAFAYMVPYFFACCVITALGLTYLRYDGETSEPQKDHKLSNDDSDDDDEELEEIAEAEEIAGDNDENNNNNNNNNNNTSSLFESSFKPVTLTFEDICYDVMASTSSEKLCLLNNVNGIFRSGRMCALMGSSGAGKTTLMEVIALRKRTGTVSGEVRLNGHLQEPISFRRCSGYVEQFDVQAPELTVRETVVFSARLRLDPDRFTTDEQKQDFVDKILMDVELKDLSSALVGTDEAGGLSFEQKKRLSIAVELASSPSLIFLDEPTSGLDARSAVMVVQTLRKIADKGRTVCATIHQPSSAVFGMFDDLLLLKKGGHVVYFGELGEDCRTLVQYFERRGATKIDLGENPANWMLRIISSSEVSLDDPAQLYLESANFAALQREIQEIKNMNNNTVNHDKIEYESEFAVPRGKRQEFVNRRLRSIYWRSPTYNLARLTVSVAIAIVLGSIFITHRGDASFTETKMNARLSVIFLSYIIIGIMAIVSVLPVMTKIRDMFYRHRDAGMYDSASLGVGLGVAEQWFIVLSSALFCIVFLAISGLGDHKVKRLIGFWGFFTFNFAIYSYFGQAFVCLVKPAATAIILCSVFIGLNNFFSGLIVRPQFMLGGFFAVPYYITPGHYVYEGLVTMLFSGVETTVTPEQGSAFHRYLINAGECSSSSSSSSSSSTSMTNETTTTTTTYTNCTGTVDDYIQYFYGGDFTRDHTLRNAIILGAFLVTTRLLTFVALKYIRFS